MCLCAISALKVAYIMEDGFDLGGFNIIPETIICWGVFALGSDNIQ